MITPDSPLIGKPSGTLDAALDYAGTDNSEYVKEVWRLGLMTGLDAALIVAQWAHETADGTSPRWVKNRNPAGLGIEADSDKDPATLTQTEAAQLHIWCMVFTVTKPLSAAFNLPQSTNAFTTRWMRKIEERNYPHPVETIADLQKRYVDSSGEPQAVWAWDDRYAAKLVAKHRAIFGVKENAADDTSDGASQGDISNVSTPVIYDLMRDYARFGISQEDAATVRGYRFENRNGFDLDAAINPEWIFIVLHVQAGTTRSSLDWWANGYVNGEKVTASSTVMIQRDGSILNVIPEQHAPWTNGDDNKPTADGMRLVSLPGNSNLYTLSIEAEGMTSDEVAKNGVQCDAIAWQVQKWRADYGIPIKNILRHADISSVDRPYCGTYRPEIIKRLTPVTPPAPQPAPIWWEPGKDVGIVTRASDGYKANAMLVQTYATTKRDVPVYDQIGGKKIAEVAAGKPAIIGGTTRARDAKATGWYFVKVDGGYGRARASSFLDKLPMP